MAAGENLITNPGAESATTGWTATGGTVARTTTAGQFRSGVAALSLTKTSAAGSGLLLWSQVAVTAGFMIEVEFWTRAGATARASYAQMDFFAGASYLTTETGVAITTSTTYQRARWLVQVPATATFVQPYLTTESMAVNEVIYIDDAFCRLLRPTPKRGRR